MLSDLECSWKSCDVKGSYEKTIQYMKTFLKTDNIRSAFKNLLYALTKYQTYEIIRAFSFKLYSLLIWVITKKSFSGSWVMGFLNSLMPKYLLKKNVIKLAILWFGFFNGS